MSAKYIIRLDDASHHMDSTKWNAIEKILDKHNIEPVVAVVPQNQDPEISFDRFNPSFWELVSSWQNKNWTIAMHGFQHTFHFINRWKLILPFYNRSEFAGLTFKYQGIKILESLKIFHNHKIYPTVWIAPGHCFNKVTVRALRKNTDINFISDGMAYRPYHYLGMTWIPQQLWDFEPKKNGLWTICLHPNTMSFEDIALLEKSIVQYKHSIISLSDIQQTKRRRDIYDLRLSFIFWFKYNFFIFYGKFKTIIGKTS